MKKINLSFFLDKYHTDIKNILQAGSHIGQEIPLFEKFTFNKIFLFEPDLKVFNVLLKNISNYENFYAHNFALGNVNQDRVMFYTSNENFGQSSSLLKPNLHKKIQSNITFENNNYVNLRRFEDLEISDVNFLIMDVQGYELEVLRGFGKKILNLDFIFTEVNRKSLYEDNVYIKDLDSYLKEHNFIRIWTSWRKSTMPWGDAFYIKTNNLSMFQKKLFQLLNLIKTNKLYFTLYFILDYKTHTERIKIKLKKILKY